MLECWFFDVVECIAVIEETRSSGFTSTSQKEEKYGVKADNASVADEQRLWIDWDWKTLCNCVLRYFENNDKQLHFHSFVLTKAKQNLIDSLVSRTRKTCADDILGKELEFLWNFCLANGHLKRFIDKTVKRGEEGTHKIGVHNKSIYQSAV